MATCGQEHSGYSPPFALCDKSVHKSTNCRGAVLSIVANISTRAGPQARCPPALPCRRATATLSGRCWCTRRRDGLQARLDSMEIAMNDTSLLEKCDERGVAWVILNRTDVLNAFDEHLIARITNSFERLGNDDAVRVIVLSANGRAFCAGADIEWMRRASQNSQMENLEDARRFAAMMDAVARCPKPVVARVQGAAYGGGRFGLRRRYCGCRRPGALRRERSQVRHPALGHRPVRDQRRRTASGQAACPDGRAHRCEGSFGDRAGTAGCRSPGTRHGDRDVHRAASGQWSSGAGSHQEPVWQVVRCAGESGGS